MSAKQSVHIISHTHWDREWYLPFEKHHVLLCKLMDQLMETLEADENYKSFHLDGQTIILDDYLQFRPEMKEKLQRLIDAGRIHIGPWYILQDEFLTSSEANLRNLQYGLKDAAKWSSNVSKLGYFPDSFGNMGQAPQILQQAGIDTAVFGRGVKPTGFNNTVSDAEDYESPYSEMNWQAPDGSTVLGILFANWYSNGNEIPVDRDQAQEFWKKKLADAEKYAATPHLLLMNGCDHQPAQTDLSEAIKVARELFPDYEFIHSDFDHYINQVKQSLPKDVKVVNGELRSQHTDGWGTLVNTASSRIYLKQLNQKGQAMLEKVAEPLASLAYLAGEQYPHHLFSYAWKTLMQNHPHDSICGCSVDEVHREMVTRFDKSRHVAEMIIDDSTAALTSRINTNAYRPYGEDAIPFTVFNTSGWMRTGVVTVELDLERQYYAKGVNRLELLNICTDNRILIDEHGQEYPFALTDLGIQFGYDLPDDQFRQPYMARKVRLTFEACEIPNLGYKTFAFVKAEKPSVADTLIHHPREMENEFFIVHFEDNGSLTVTDKMSGNVFTKLCVYEDSGDIGNEYMYRQPDGEKALTTEQIKAEIRIIEDTPFQAAFEIVHHWGLPSRASEQLDSEQSQLVWFTARKSQRVQETTPFTIKTIVKLEKHGKGIDVTASFDNQVTDHRLRVLFPTEIDTHCHYADSIFEVAKRDNQPSSEWKNPSNCQHQHAFVSVHNQEAGLTIANKGLNEYEILRDGKNTIAITILRAVRELGDWGYFPTPEAQCLGEQTVHFKIIPYGNGSYTDAYQFQIPWVVKQASLHDGDLPLTQTSLEWSGPKLAFSSMKVAEETGDVMLRWYNLSDEQETLAIPQPLTFYKSNVLEQESTKLENEISINKYEIVTIGLKKKESSRP
ncbi:glycoside hydrolase family protein [Neobacillus bataviensis LMG 21833]|uniref:Glycoside hydrolase family protein n=1 Tax=Neobacillus bataviensis LMG 21833 TaxID=1117379 RepID=K6DA84_9BACI|nr:alpha-mannosidase [Neobacillus bataviensis]EKN65229.1 glycoside hydrolase family protein [Neobacillus bataviensis LMG 21833]